MPNIQSAKKRVRVTEKKTLQNRMIKSQIKTLIKKFEAVVAEGNKEEAASEFNIVVRKLDQAVSKGTYHKSTVSRKKSALAKKLNAVNA